MTPDQSTDWRSLAEQASIEPDPEKLMSLVAALNRVLDEREKATHRMQLDPTTKPR